MKRTFMGMLAAMAISFAPTMTVVAEEITFASHAEVMSVLERQNMRIAELEAALHNGGGCTSCGDSCGDSCCDSCCSSCCDPCCRPSGVIGGAEILFLKPHHSAGIQGVHTDLEYGYEVAPRIWAGYQGSDGLGWRVRYFEFNHGTGDPFGTLGADPTPPGVGTVDTVNYDTYIFDLEFMDSMSLGCYWDATWFAGFRYVEFDEDKIHFNADGTILDAIFHDFSGYGLTVGGELRRCIGNGLAGFVNTRASVLMGDEDQTVVAPVRAIGNDEEIDNIYFIYEAQSGVQWTRELEAGGYLFARAAVEVQIWDNFAHGLDNGNDGDADWGLGGAAFSAGIIR